MKTKGRPKLAEPTERVTLRLPAAIIRQVEELARKNRRTLQLEFRIAIEDRLAAQGNDKNG